MMFLFNEWTRQGDCLTLFLVVIAAGRRSAQRRILAEHGEWSLMMRGNGLQRSGMGDRTSTDAMKRVTDIEQGRRTLLLIRQQYQRPQRGTTQMRTMADVRTVVFMLRVKTESHRHSSRMPKLYAPNEFLPRSEARG